MIGLFILSLVAAFLGYLANRIAGHKGRNRWAWTFFTVILIFPLLILLILPPVASNNSSHPQNI